jgi:hypothetical protein
VLAGGQGRAVLVEVYLLRCHPDGRLAYRRVAGHLQPGETPDSAAERVGLGVVGVQDGLVVAVHSTSWRHLDDGTIVLTYVVLPDPEPGVPAITVQSRELARGASARRPSPRQVRHEQVAVHAARHLALIASTDPLVGRVLDRSPELGRVLALLDRAPAGQLPG